MKREPITQEEIDTTLLNAGYDPAEVARRFGKLARRELLKVQLRRICGASLYVLAFCIVLVLCVAMWRLVPLSWFWSVVMGFIAACVAWGVGLVVVDGWRMQ